MLEQPCHDAAADKLLSRRPPATPQTGGRRPEPVLPSCPQDRDSEADCSIERRRASRSRSPLARACWALLADGEKRIQGVSARLSKVVPTYGHMSPAVHAMLFQVRKQRIEEEQELAIYEVSSTLPPHGHVSPAVLDCQRTAHKLRDLGC
eukprot:TRINITY_DN63928_c0_g1_i1.p1 TRINITY_DN63928_c0_g1~~TRINITY_DN63928_c0_g1_i1.p1  ORF type:complete len:150 (+),score=24.80 TRINITY_DN63928_c0_g1_i1:48-497(+)